MPSARKKLTANSTKQGSKAKSSSSKRNRRQQESESEQEAPAARKTKCRKNNKEVAEVVHESVPSSDSDGVEQVEDDSEEVVEGADGHISIDDEVTGTL